MTHTPYDDLIRQTANHFQLDGDLLIAQVVVESAGDPWAFRFEPAFFRKYVKKNPQACAFNYGPLAACSYGLLQILLETACEAGFTDHPWALFDPSTNLHWGGLYLRRLYDLHSGDVSKALLAYNGGGAPGYPESIFRLREQWV